MRRAWRSGAMGLASGLALSGAAFAGNSSYLLVDDAEVCKNGARFVARVSDSLAVGPTMTGQIFTPGDVLVAAGSTHVFGAVGDRFRFEVDYSSAPFVAGMTLKLSVSSTPGGLEGAFGHHRAERDQPDGARAGRCHGDLAGE